VLEQDLAGDVRLTYLRQEVSELRLLPDDGRRRR